MNAEHLVLKKYIALPYDQSQAKTKNISNNDKKRFFYYCNIPKKDTFDSLEIAYVKGVG